MKRIQSLGAFLVLIVVLVSHPSNATSPVDLSSEEHAWIARNSKIRVSGPQAFPPFQYFDEDGVFKGMASDYIFFIAEMVGLEVEVVKKQPWSEILKKIENKEIDMLTCAAVTPEREAYLMYTKPYLSFPLIIISRKDAPFISGVDSLHKLKLAAIRKNASIEWLRRDNINVVPHYVDSPLEALKQVSLGHADVAIENLAAATYLIEKNGLSNLKIAAPTSYENYTLSVAVRNDWPELVSILNKGFAAISQEKHNEIRQKWIAVRYEHGVRAKDIILWTVSVGLIALILILIYHFWNKKLVNEIQERKRTEREKENLIVELKDALGNIKTLHGILPICCECKSIRDDKGYWKKIERYIRDHSEADFSHGLCPNCMIKLYGKEEWFEASVDSQKGKSD